MVFPQKAIICLPTYEDAVKLDNFVREHKGWYFQLEDWSDDGEETCCDIDVTGDGEILHMSRAGYEEAIESCDNEPEYGAWKYVPEDKSLRFISVDEFIAVCSHVETAAEDASILYVEEGLL